MDTGGNSRQPKAAWYRLYNTIYFQSIITQAIETNFQSITTQALETCFKSITTQTSTLSFYELNILLEIMPEANSCTFQKKELKNLRLIVTYSSLLEGDSSKEFGERNIFYLIAKTAMSLKSDTI